MGTTKIPARLSVAAKPCDYCNSATAVLFCRPDAAFMCVSCDEKSHKITDKHARVWMCEVCEQAPAVVTCKADAAALCATCDREIHSVNSLASRHERVPVTPFYDSAKITVMKSTGVTEGGDNIFAAPGDKLDTCIDLNGYIRDSWISPNPAITAKIQTDLKAVDYLFSDSDQFLVFDNYQIPLSQTYNDGLVPVQATIEPPVPVQLTHDHLTGNRFEIDFTRSNISSYNNNSSYNTPSLSHSVSSSSMDVGVVPDGSSISDTSYTFMNPTVDLSGNQGSKIVGMDREARVLRYKEKRKNRKFEKTIRYASRKAYAETRPRIKGRFAKRTDSEPDMDRIFGAGASSFAADARYAVVPSF